jgi:hypothetical protein
VTPQYACRLVRSIAYRRHLLENLPELETELMSYVRSTETKYLSGYEISVVDNYLHLREMEPLEWRQLKLKLDGVNAEPE